MDIPVSSVVLTLGSPAARNQILAKVGPQHDIFIFSCTVQFDRNSLSDTFQVTRNISKHDTCQDLAPLEVNHSDFGGATNAAHLILYLYSDVDLRGFQAPPAIPRTLSHLLDAAARRHFPSIGQPCNLGHPIARTPIVVDGFLLNEVLFDVHNPHQSIACPSVFSTMKWISNRLTFQELLRVFDIPHSMDGVFQTRQNRDMVFTRPSNLAFTISHWLLQPFFVICGELRGG